MPARNLIVCADGTGNRAAKGRGTNVWKIYEAVDRHSDDRGGPVQLATHHDGVGTSTNRLMAALGGAFGVGLAANVRELYGWLCEHYQAGDRIFMFGFSRGAFTVRCLAGLVARCGLVDLDQAGELANARITEAWRLYKRSHHVTSAIREAEQFRDSFGIEIPDEDDPSGDTRTREVPVHFVGVWDTVDAYGMPIDEVKEALSLLSRTILKVPWAPLHRFTLAEFGSYGLHPSIRCGRHAIALDDERFSFHPMLWEEDRREGLRPDRRDVPESSGATEDRRSGRPDRRGQGASAADSPQGVEATVAAPGGSRRRGERRGIEEHGGLAVERRTQFGEGPEGERRSSDRRRPESDRRRIQQVWFTGMHSDVGGGYARDSLSLVSLDWMMACAEEEGLWIEPFRRERIAKEMNPLGPMHDSRAGLANYYRYRPRHVKALCERYGVAQPHIHGSVLHRIAATGKAPTVMPAKFAVATGRKLKMPSARPTEEHRRLLGGIVWWRSLLYYLFLGWTAAVAWSIADALPEAVNTPSPAWSLFGMGHVFSWLGRASPAFASDWLLAIRNQPSISLLYVGVLLALILASARLRHAEDRIADGGWEGKEPKGMRALYPMLLKGNWWRRPTNWVGGILARVVPIATLAVLGWGLWLGVGTILGGGRILPADAPPESLRAPLASTEQASFRIGASQAGFQVPMIFEGGETYTIRVDSVMDWSKDGMDGDPAAGVPEASGVRDVLRRPFKRRYGTPTLVLLGSWGSVNGDQFVIGDSTQVTVPGTRGQDMYVYANDVTCYVLCRGGGPWTYYTDNRGSARVTISKVRR